MPIRQTLPTVASLGLALLGPLACIEDPEFAELDELDQQDELDQLDQQDELGEFGGAQLLDDELPGGPGAGDELALVDETAFADELPAADGALGLDTPDPEADNEAFGCLGLPSTVLADANNSATVQGSLSNIVTGSYFLDASVFPFPQGTSWAMWAGTTLVAQLFQPATVFVATQGTPIELFMRVPTSVTPGTSFDFDVRLYNVLSQLVCSQQVTLKVPDCSAVGWWHQNPWPTPNFDGANCWVTGITGNPFIWNNSWYVEPNPGPSCPMGSFDGANCYVGSAPGGHTAFIYNNSFYFTP